MRRFYWDLLFAVTALVVFVGCTLGEWQQVGSDALASVPQAVTDIATNPTPAGVLIVIGTFLSGLVAKSAARGFGRGTVITTKAAARGASSLVTGIVNAFKK